MASLFHYALASYTYDKTKEYVWDNEGCAYSLAVVMVLSNAYLLGGAIIGTAQKAANMVGNLFSKMSTPSINSQMRPRLSFALKVIGLLTDICALGPTIVIWHDYFEENKKEEVTFEHALCVWHQKKVLDIENLCHKKLSKENE